MSFMVHARTSIFNRVPSVTPSICIRLYNRVLHFKVISSKFNPPSYFERCSVVTGTLKSDACHMCHLQMAVSC